MRAARFQLLIAASLGALLQSLLGRIGAVSGPAAAPTRSFRQGERLSSREQLAAAPEVTPALSELMTPRSEAWMPISYGSVPILHVLKLQSRPGDLFTSIEFGAVPGYLYSGKMPHSMPIRYLHPTKHSNVPSGDAAASADIRHLFVFDARPPTIRAAHVAIWGKGSLQQAMSKAELQRAYWAQPGHSIGIGVFRDEQGQIPYPLLDRAPWGYIFRTFWHNSLPGTERPSVPLGTMSCRGTAHVRWARTMVSHLAALRSRLRAPRREPGAAGSPPAGQGGLPRRLGKKGGGGGYAAGMGGPKGGWWPDRPKSVMQGGGGERTKAGGPRQRWGGGRQRQLWEGSIDVKADRGAAVTHVSASDVAGMVAAAAVRAREGPLLLFASQRLGVVPPVRDGADEQFAAAAHTRHACLHSDAVGATLSPAAACFNSPGAEARALAFLPRALLAEAEEGGGGTGAKGGDTHHAWARALVRQSVAAALRHIAGGVIPPLQSAAAGGLQAGTVPPVGFMPEQQQLTAAALQRAHDDVAQQLQSPLGTGGSTGDATAQLAARSLCGRAASLSKWGLLKVPEAAWADVCDVTFPVWHTHVEMNWVWSGALPGQLIPSSRRKKRCLWNGSLRAFRARTVDFFRRWNAVARALWGAGAVECDMRNAKRFMGDWGSDENHAVFRDVVFGPNLAGNSPESIRHFDQLAAGVVSVTVTSETAPRDDEMWSDGAWPCGRPPGIYATSWLDAAVQMQALWQNPAELDTLQMAGSLWLQRHQACVRRDAEQVVGAAMQAKPVQL